MAESTKERVEWVDVAKGMAIILMVLGHCVNIESRLRPVIFSFHMPFFIMISGYFYKKTSLRTFLKKQYKGLFIPYVLTVIAMYIFKILLQELDLRRAIFTGFFTVLAGVNYTKLIQFPFAEGIGVLWFLPMIFCVRIIFYGLEYFIGEKYFMLGIATIALASCGYWLGLRGYWLPFSLDVALYGVSFYYVGYILGRFKIIEPLMHDIRYILIFFFIWIFGLSQKVVLEMATRYYPEIFTCILIALSGSLILITFSYYISKINILKKVFAWYGAGSIYVFCLHHLEWSFFPYASFNINSQNTKSFFITKLIVITFLYIVIIGFKKIEKSLLYYFVRN